MAAEETCTWDLPAPRRATLEDLGGADYEDDPDFAPDPVTMPNAREWNQKAEQLAAINRVIPLAIIIVTFSGGTPAITGVFAPGVNVTTSDFLPTDNAAGDTTIDWAVGVLPNGTHAEAHLIADVEIDRVRAFMPDATSVTVKTKLGATGTDCNFAVHIY